MRSVLAILLSSLLLIPATPASAGFREAEYEQQGVCFDHPDPVFGDALGGRVNADAGFRNARLHWHVQWLINNGTISSRDELIGRCAIMWFQTVRDERGNDHLNGFLQKDESFIHFVSESVALAHSSQEAADNYFKRGDVEMAGSTGCADVGSTKAGRGNSGGDCRN